MTDRNKVLKEWLLNDQIRSQAEPNPGSNSVLVSIDPHSHFDVKVLFDGKFKTALQPGGKDKELKLRPDVKTISVEATNDIGNLERSVGFLEFYDA